MIPYLVLIVSQVFSSKDFKDNLGDTDSAWNFLGVTGYAGHITMNYLTGSSIFYWLFESIDGNITTDSRPLIIWLEGGPGCSGTFTMIWQGVSPISLNYNTEPTRTNPNSTWAENYHVISIDFPYGVGYSFANSDSDLKNNTLDATFYLYKFLVKLGKKYPNWLNRDIYIFGYSYAGHWVPALAYHIIQQNQIENGFKVNLKGIGISGAWVTPLIQNKYFAKFAVASSTINENQASIFTYYQDLIINQINNGEFVQATLNMKLIWATLTNLTNGIDIYNVRGYETYDDTNLYNWITSRSVREMLNVGNTPWSDCNKSVNHLFWADMSTPTDYLLSYCLESGLPVLLFSGQDDFVVNFAGLQEMISALNWTGIPSFLSSPRNLWTVDDKVAGYIQSNKNLSVALVLNSGHMTPYDQPLNIKNLVEGFINGAL